MNAKQKLQEAVSAIRKYRAGEMSARQWQAEHATFYEAVRFARAADFETQMHRELSLRIAESLLNP